MPEFGTISEIILYAQDMDSLFRFYHEVLGLEVTSGDPDHGFVQFETGTCDLCLHAGGEGDIGRDAPKFTFNVQDLGAAREHLQSHDVEMSAVRNPAPETYVFDCLDPEGNSFSVEATTPPE